MTDLLYLHLRVKALKKSHGIWTFIASACMRCNVISCFENITVYISMFFIVRFLDFVLAGYVVMTITPGRCFSLARDILNSFELMNFICSLCQYGHVCAHGR
jgi:hypothetical protein